MLETVREVNKIINNFRGEREVYNVDLFIRSTMAQRFPRIVELSGIMFD
jgi:hypothetical protein